MNTPGLFVIDKDFDDFNPREDQWLYFNFGRQIYDSSISLDEYEDTLGTFAEIISNPERDFFEEALPIVRKLKLAEAAEIFEAKPSIFGFSIDLKKAASILMSMFI